MPEDDTARAALQALQNAEADASARQTAEALIAAHVSETGKVTDERSFADAIAAAMIAATTAGRLQNR